MDDPAPPPGPRPAPTDARPGARLDALAARLAALVGDRARVLRSARLDLGRLGVLPAELALLEPAAARGPGPAAALDLGRVLLVVGADPARRDAWLPLAAAAEVPEAWAIDAAADLVEVLRAPADARYRLRTVAWRGEALPLPRGLGRLEPLPRGPDDGE